MRLFVAAQLPQGLSELLAETSARLRCVVPGRYVAPDSFHVTLAFMGEHHQSDLPEIVWALEQACRGHGSFRARLAELGLFGTPAKAILWQGFTAGAKEFTTLAESVRLELRGVGIPYDTTTFKPHVTLMRTCDLSCGLLPAPCVGEGAISSVALFSSDLSGPRPLYEALHVVPLEDGHLLDAWSGV